MPAVSQKQRSYLYWKFGADWVRRHHFDNRGKLPTYAHSKTRAGGRPKSLGMRER